VDALVFEFMGLAVVGLCVIVLMVPSARRPSERRVRDLWPAILQEKSWQRLARRRLPFALHRDQSV